MSSVTPVTTNLYRTAIQHLKDVGEASAERLAKDAKDLTASETQKLDKFTDTWQSTKPKTNTTPETENTGDKAKKNIFRRGWDGIKKGYNKIISIIKWPYTQLKSLFSKSTEKEAKTGEAATQTESQTQTQNTTATSNTEGGTTTETKPPTTNTSNQDSTQTQTAA